MSESNLFSISEKSASPMPTIMIEQGWSESLTIVARLSSESWMMPSVRMTRIWYFFSPAPIDSTFSRNFSKTGLKFEGPEKKI